MYHFHNEAIEKVEKSAMQVCYQSEIVTTASRNTRTQTAPQ